MQEVIDTNDDYFEPLQTRPIGVKWGINIGLIMAIYSFLLWMTGLYKTQALGYVSFLILIVGIVIAQNEYKKKGNGMMSFGQGMSLSAWFLLVASVISGVFSYIYMKFIDSSILQYSYDVAEKRMEERGMSQSDIDQAMSISKKFMTPEISAVSAIVSVFIIGIIIALIITAINKKSA